MVLEQFAHLLVWILDERLADQGHFAQILANTALDHLLDNVVRFTALPGLRLGNLAFFCQHLRRHLIFVHANRVAGSDMHGQIAPQILVTTAYVDQHANSHAVTVARQRPLHLMAEETTHGHVLADLRNKGLTRLLNGGVLALVEG